jgi:hypothetical protein
MIRQEESCSWRGGCIIVMLQSDRMSQVHDHVVVFMSCFILPDSRMTILQPSLHELDSSCLTGTLHEYNFLAMNLTHPAWLKHDMNTTSLLWTWLILPDWAPVRQDESTSW